MTDSPAGAGSGGGTPLQRVVGVPGAVALGLGSILGTGVFVSLGISAGVAGPAVVAAVALGAVLALCNGLSSAQLAASHPVSGGTYEYGYRYLNPSLGFSAGWMFLCAKSASAATGALGLAGYLLTAFDVDATTELRTGLALILVALLTLVVAGGLRRSNRMNTAILTVTLAGLAAFVAAGLPATLRRGADAYIPFLGDAGIPGLLEATALMFVAYTGYGRIATLGEEVRDPARSIPRAMILTLLATMALYAGVAAVAVGVAGADVLAQAAIGGAPLEVLARGMGIPGLGIVVALAAMTAMAGVILNLLLGLSRVLLAMGRRSDMPATTAVVDTDGSPRNAVWWIGVIICALVLVGDVRTTWAFSAFTVLVYYALTNLAALRLRRADRRYPRIVSIVGLLGCLGLAFQVTASVWMTGTVVLAAGLAVRAAARLRRGDTRR